LLDFEPEVGEDYCNLLYTLPGGRTQDYIPGTKRLTIWSPKSTNWTRRQDEVAEGMVSWLCHGGFEFFFWLNTVSPEMAVILSLKPRKG
jgi:hypothetical protein